MARNRKVKAHDMYTELHHGASSKFELHEEVEVQEVELEEEVEPAGGVGPHHRRPGRRSHQSSTGRGEARSTRGGDEVEHLVGWAATRDCTLAR